MRIRSIFTPSDERVRSNLYTRELHVRAETLDEDARTVEAVIATENEAFSLSLRDYSLVLEVYLADGFEQPKKKQVPLLDSHNRYSTESIRGSVRNFRVVGKNIVGTLHFGTSESAEADWQNVRDGHLTDVSGGFRPIKSIEIMQGKSRSIRGRVFTAPDDHKLYVHTRWTLGETSLACIGADEDAKIRGDQQQTRGPIKAALLETSTMNEHLRAYLESLGLASDADDAAADKFYEKLTGNQRSIADALHTRTDTGNANTDANQQATQTPTAAPATNTRSQQTADTQRVPVAGGADGDGAVRTTARTEAQIIADEHARQDTIRNLPMADECPELIRTLLGDSNITPDTAARRILEHQRGSRVPPHGQAPSVHTRQANLVEQTRALAAAMSLRAGVSMDHLVVRGADDPEKARQQAANQSERYADLSLVDVCRACLQLEGRSIPHSRDEMIRSAGATSVFSNIFTDSVNARVEQSFMDAPDSTFWAEETEVADFKTNTDITMNKTSGMKKLGRGGTAEFVESGDTAETYKIARYAGQFRMDEQDIIDDNFGIMADISDEMINDASQLRPQLVYAVLLSNPTMGEDSVALFHAASHSNLASDALSITALSSGITAMAKQTKNSRQLNIKARYLLCAQDLAHTAKIITQSPVVVQSSAGTTDATTVRGARNVLYDENLTVVADNYLGVAGVTDPATGTAYAGAATRWYLAGERRTIRVAYRRGTGRRPVVRSYVLDRGQFGIGFDIHLDIGAYARDYRSLYLGNDS